MWTLWGRSHQLCHGVSRREFLRVGGLGLLGVTLADLLRAQAHAGPRLRRAKSVIYIVLAGGPSQIDTWDPKPSTPAEIRGEFGTIPTRVPSARFCELFVHQAA